jgi:hypothetical protein
LVFFDTSLQLPEQITTTTHTPFNFQLSHFPIRVFNQLQAFMAPFSLPGLISQVLAEGIPCLVSARWYHSSLS